ncbi:MAG: protein kinase, partial [Gemmataceae bacterium]|nr:protein kinase [Gemmataceae bacterium]
MNWLREPDAEPIPGYRLLCPLGTGGFGEVWKCVAPGNIHKAIKFVYGNLNSLDGDGYRAEQEFKAVQKMKEIRHPFILSMERVDIVEGDLAIVMELADSSLHDLLQQYQAEGYPGIPRQKLLRYLRDAADGLDYLNDCGLQHLDVKPRNLFLVGDRVKVADFGLVKNLDRQSSSGLLAGVTPIYAAPETFSGKFSRHSDQYSLAIVYIELLTGKRPFNGKSIRSLAFQHVSEPPDLSEVPPTDRPILLRALAKDPEERFPSCQAMISALMQASPKSDDDGLSPASPRSQPTPSRKGQSDTKSPVEPHRNGVALSGLERTVVNAETAILRPTLIVAAGNFGRKALLDLRYRLLDRLGDLSQVPVFRFLYIDSDPEGLHDSQQGVPGVALSASQVFPLPLQPVTNYRRRTLEHLSDWLPREKLNALPRSLQPHGSRALGRLAFHDNYLRLMTRLRRELQIATHPESLAESVSQTGLLLRDNHPRIIILASACGGSAGMIVDLAYALNRLCQQLHLKSEKPNLFLFCGAPGDPATPAEELANLYATLTEVHHYHAGETGFSAQYGPDCKPVIDASAPIPVSYTHL